MLRKSDIAEDNKHNSTKEKQTLLPWRSEREK